MTTIKSLRKASLANEIPASLIAMAVADKLAAQAIIDNDDIDLKLARFPRLKSGQAEAIIRWADKKLAELRVPADLTRAYTNLLKPEVDTEVKTFKEDLAWKALIKDSESDTLDIDGGDDETDSDDSDDLD